jgi:hypothetical protein
MNAKKKEEELLNVIQSLSKACDDLDEISQGLTSEQKNRLNDVNNTVLDARIAVSDVLIQDKEDGLMLKELKNVYSMAVDFLAENGLITKFIKYINKYDY